jgi:hypothetical protein
MLRWLMIFALVAGVVYFGSTVKLGQRTLFGHVRAIWATDEVQDMRKGLGEKAGPALDRVKRGVRAGIEAAAGDDNARAADAGADGSPEAIPSRP